MNNEIKRAIIAIGANADDIGIDVGATLLCGCEVAESFIWVRRPVRRYAKLSGVASTVIEEFTVS